MTDTAKRYLWAVLRLAIDSAAVFLAWSIQYAASRDMYASAITAAAVSAYGCWCFYDGTRR